jgi:intracellular sulfur oxidation DsrE/DsrF family protein
MTRDRREFLTKLGLGALAIGSGGAFVPPLSAEELEPLGGAAGGPESPWDMSWVQQLEKTTYKAVFDSPSLADGAALDLAAGIWYNFKEAYGTDDNVRMVIIMRQMGQVMAFNDMMWEKYGIGEERKVNDPVTKQPARRNPWAKTNPGDPEWAVASKLDTLRARGAIFLVCNRASMNWASSTAERMKLDVEVVKNDVRNNLVPGAILMPTGVFALVRAQNTGCAYMRGS